MTNPERPPMFGSTYCIDLHSWKPRSGKCFCLTPDVLAKLMKTNDAITEPALEHAELALVSPGA